MARVLAIDPGSRRCGVAISDSARTMAFPRPALAAGDVLEGVARLVDEEGVDLVVVGRPVALSGTATASTALAEDLAARLRAGLDVAVTQFDERLTTTAAQRSLREAGLKEREHRARIDSAAAVVMLQHFLEASA